MSILHIDGFDGYATFTDMNQEYNSANAGIILTTGGRFGAGGFQCDANDGRGVTKYLTTGAGYTEVWSGIAMKVNDLTGGVNRFAPVLSFVSALGVEMNVAYQGGATNQWLVYRGYTAGSGGVPGTQVGSAYTGFTNPGNWHWIEARYVMHATAGVFELWIDGVQVINLTAINSKQNASATGINQVRLGDWDVRHLNRTFDDWYISDTAGAAPTNTRLGDCKVVSLTPTADATPNDGTPSTGATHWGVVDESQYNTTDYVDITATSGNRELFGMSDLSGSNVVYGVKVTVESLKTDAADVVLAPVIKSGATESVGPSYGLLTTNYQRQSMIASVDPATSAAWTVSGVNALVAGVKII